MDQLGDMATLESNHGLSWVSLAHQFVSLIFVAALLVLGWHSNSWILSCALLAVAGCLSALVSQMRISADSQGVVMKWLWRTHTIPWSSVRSVVYKRELIGGRLSIALWTAESLRLSSWDSLARIESAANRYCSTEGAPTPQPEGLPWWLTRLRP
jgi:hypothetical protein